jgi:cation:H+ antiporter
MQFFMLFAGLAGLWAGTQLTIRGAVSIAERLMVPEFVIGVVILSIGSDLPELAIAIDAAIKNLHSGQASDVVVGSALGSSLGQFGLVLGVMGLISTLLLKRQIVVQQGFALLASIVLLGTFAFDSEVSRIDGIVLVTVYVLYLAVIGYRVANYAKTRRKRSPSRVGVHAAYLVAGLLLVTVGAEVTVASAVQVAEILEVEQALIAILVLGLGTSVPELAISIGAILKKKTMLSVGNLIGSNVFDTLVPIGVAAIIAPLEFNVHMLRQELPVLFGLTVLILLFFLGSRGIRRPQAGVILGLYFVYVAAKVLGA